MQDQLSEYAKLEDDFYATLLTKIFTHISSAYFDLRRVEDGSLNLRREFGIGARHYLEDVLNDLMPVLDLVAKLDLEPMDQDLDIAVRARYDAMRYLDARKSSLDEEYQRRSKALDESFDYRVNLVKQETRKEIERVKGEMAERVNTAVEKAIRKTEEKYRGAPKMLSNERRVRI